MTIDINELRQLAQAATPGPDGISLSWVRLLRDFQQGASPAAITEILDRLEAAEKECDALRADKATLQQMMYSLKDRLEAAEKSDAESLAMYRKARDERDALRAAVRHEADCVEACKSEIDALRAKVAEMERPESGFRERCTPEDNFAQPAPGAPWVSLAERMPNPDKHDRVLIYTEGYDFGGEQVFDVKAEALNECRYIDPDEQPETCKAASHWMPHPRNAIFDYAAHCAQPAPSVPTALLVAVADLIAQMEIVSRVGFIDTPDDKDSCAAFCVAEGTWLELMSAIESLASALAAAPEAKP